MGPGRKQQDVPRSSPRPKGAGPCLNNLLDDIVVGNRDTTLAQNRHTQMLVKWAGASGDLTLYIMTCLV